MINIKITFSIKTIDNIDEVHSLIKAFITNIRNNEPDTVFYKSFQEKDNPCDFIHIMSFKDEVAQQKHRNSPYCKEFVSKLYPLCSDAPVAVALDEIF